MFREAYTQFYVPEKADPSCSELTTAALQHFFILHRRSTALEAVEHVQDLVEELELRTAEQAKSRVDGVVGALRNE